MTRPSRLTRRRIYAAYLHAARELWLDGRRSEASTKLRSAIATASVGATRAMRRGDSRAQFGWTQRAGWAAECVGAMAEILDARYRDTYGDRRTA